MLIMHNGFWRDLKKIEKRNPAAAAAIATWLTDLEDQLQLNRDYWPPCDGVGGGIFEVRLEYSAREAHKVFGAGAYKVWIRVGVAKRKGAAVLGVYDKNQSDHKRRESEFFQLCGKRLKELG